MAEARPRDGRLRYVGHATVLVELNGVRMLTDPVLRRRVGHIRRIAPLVPAGELLPLDAVLISHAHGDHLDVPSLRRLAPACPVVAPVGSRALLRRAHAREIIELDVDECCTIGGIQVHAMAAEHDGRRHPFGQRIPALGFILEGPSRVYFAGDTDYFASMVRLAGRVDVALLPVAGWGPRLPAGHMNPEAAARAAALIQPEVAVPIHWGTMLQIGVRGSDPSAPARAFASAVAALEPPVRARILAPGESMALPITG